MICATGSPQHRTQQERKLFKMRELRGAGVVKVNHMPGEANQLTSSPRSWDVRCSRSIARLCSFAGW